MFNDLFYSLRNLKPVNLPFTFDDTELGFDRAVWIEDKPLTFTYDMAYHGFDEAAWMNISNETKARALSNSMLKPNLKINKVN